ncbi:MAG TPA: type II secretion system F family protein [Planctomycetota bacterium]|nr:type II secretion system F family protein [Planctomycetota bacterium]
MAAFNYKAKRADGSIITGSVNATTETEAVMGLRRQGLMVLSMTSGKGSTKSAGGSIFGGKKKVKVKSVEMVVFTRQLSTMISSGIPLMEAIEILGEQTTNPGFKATLHDIATNVRAGKDLSQALSAHPRLFPDIYTNMIKAGEASGQLDIVLSRLADYQEAAENLKSEIKSAMTYPVVSLILVLGIALFLLVFIIPKFEEMFTSLNVELPWITKALLATSILMKKYFLIWFGGVIVAFIALLRYFRTDKGQTVRDWIFLNIPVFGPLFSKVAISRFARTFATLIQSGVPILGALEIVAQTCGNRLFAKAVMVASDSVRQGETLGEPLGKSKLFPPMVTKMISIGEKTGALETLLEKISDFYDQQVKATVESLTSLIEPIMIGVMGFLVGGMVMAIFLPIFKMVGALSGKGG